MGLLLSVSGFHRPSAWAARPVPSSPGRSNGSESDMASSSSFEEETAITKVLRSVDPSLLDDSPGGVNALTRRLKQACKQGLCHMI